MVEHFPISHNGYHDRMTPSPTILKIRTIRVVLYKDNPSYVYAAAQYCENLG